jgi:hypothetical protein
LCICWFIILLNSGPLILDNTLEILMKTKEFLSPYLRNPEQESVLFMRSWCTSVWCMDETDETCWLIKRRNNKWYVKIWFDNFIETCHFGFRNIIADKWQNISHMNSVYKWDHLSFYFNLSLHSSVTIAAPHHRYIYTAIRTKHRY